ncbi:SCP2 domain-containing protein [Azonexus sp.]|uniref:ubiquinone biosynthesis accessory factor UbiJ n=1 Tax=Azonexus sp. TaxID=1872668 RepID=UPI0039E2642A
MPLPERARRFFLAPLNHVLRQNSWAQAKLRPHAASTVLLTSAGRALFACQITATGEFALAAFNENADVCIELPENFLKLLAQDHKALFAQAHLSGRAELAETLAFVLRNLRWDSEADLAHIFGDIAAHRVDRFARRSLIQTREAVRRSLENLRDYLKEESGLTVAPEDLGDFSRKNAKFTQQLAALERRLEEISP